MDERNNYNSIPKQKTMLKITLETNFVKCEIEQEGDDIYELIDLFKRASIGIGYDEKTFNSGIIDYYVNIEQNGSRIEGNGE